MTLPPSTTRKAPPEDATSVIIAKSAILVEGEPIVAVKNGDVDPSEKTEGQFGIEVGRLTTMLKAHHTRIKKIAAFRGEEPSNELTIIADKETPYRLVYSVMYSAGQAEFQNFRLIVIRNEDG